MDTYNINKILRPKLLLIYFLLLAGLYLFSLWQREADIDDAWIGEHAYWLAKEGHARSELMRGITQQEDYLVVHHKLLTLHGALFIKLFGFSLYSLKSVSLAYFFAFGIMFYYYSVKKKKIAHRGQLILCALILLTFPWVFKYSFVYRPEMMIMAMTFASWILLEEIVEGSSHRWISAVAAGMLGGLCFAAHLNGIVVAGAGFILLILNRKWVPSLAFGLAALAGMAVYFYDFNASYGWSFWWMQFSESPALDSLPETNPLIQSLLNLANEHKRFFHDPMIASFSIFILFSLFAGFKLLLHKRKNMLLYTFLLALLLGLSAVHKSRQYLLVYFPFLAIMASDVYYSYFLRDRQANFFDRWRNKKAISALLILFLFGYLSSGLFYNLRYSQEKFNVKDNELITEKYVTEDPENINIVAPMTFIFNEIEKFGRIQSDVCYVELQKEDPTVIGAGFLERTKAFDIRYIILSGYFRERLGWEHPELVHIPEDFEIISGSDDAYLVIRRK